MKAVISDSAEGIEKPPIRIFLKFIKGIFLRITHNYLKNK